MGSYLLFVYADTLKAVCPYLFSQIILFNVRDKLDIKTSSYFFNFNLQFGTIIVLFFSTRKFFRTIGKFKLTTKAFSFTIHTN